MDTTTTMTSLYEQYRSLPTTPTPLVVTPSSLPARPPPARPPRRSREPIQSSSSSSTYDSSSSPASSSESETDSTSSVSSSTTISSTSSSSSPSSSSRHLFYAVRKGRCPGVYTEWPLAWRQVEEYPDSSAKTFSTRLAAEAFVQGWDGAGRHSLPPSSPQPLREYLALEYGTAMPSGRAKYHARLMSEGAMFSATPPPPPFFSSSSSSSLASTSSSLAVPRPVLNRSTSYLTSTVRISSPLRQQVGDDDSSSTNGGSRTSTPRSFASLAWGNGGLLTPPHSPEEAGKPKPIPVMMRDRPVKARAPDQASPWAATTHRAFPGSALSPPASPKRVASTGLWADIASATSSPAGSSSEPSAPTSPTSPTDPSSIPHLQLPESSAPKFSRSGLKRSGVVMPTSAPRTSPSSVLPLNALKTRSSRSSLKSSASSSSLATLAPPSLAAVASPRNLLNPQRATDRLASLVATSRGSSGCTPPRAAYLRSPSTSSLSSTTSSVASSVSSVTSLTSASSFISCSSVDKPGPIEEEPAVEAIYDGDGESSEEDHRVVPSDDSIESSSIKSTETWGRGGSGGGAGMFKRFSKVLKLEKSEKRLAAGAGRRGNNNYS